MKFDKCPRLSTCQEHFSKDCDNCILWKTYKQGFEDGATATANAVNNYIQNDFAESLEREILYGRDK